MANIISFFSSNIINIFIGTSTLLSFIFTILQFRPMRTSSRSARSWRIILISGILITLTLGILVFFPPASTTQNPSPKPKPSSPFIIYQSASDIPEFATKVVWDRVVVTNHSFSITLDLQPNTSTVTSQNTLATKFGAKYTFYVIAQLDMSGTIFQVDPKTQDQQPLSQGLASFHWIATPLHNGIQDADIIVKGIWIPQQKEDTPITYYLGSHIWNIAVADDTPLFAPFQINISAALAFLFGILFNVTVWEFARKLIAERKQKPTQSIP